MFIFGGWVPLVMDDVKVACREIFSVYKRICIHRNHHIYSCVKVVPAAKNFLFKEELFPHMLL
jgi:hypothetical protein